MDLVCKLFHVMYSKHAVFGLKIIHYTCFFEW